MSESVAMPAESSAPKTIYLKDYKVPVYLIDEVHLNFDLDEDYTIVHSHMHVRHNRLSKDPERTLKLNGEELILESVKLDGVLLEKNAYQLTDKHLILKNLPDNFDLDIKVKIFPQKNTALSGLYRSGNTYCTQCEAEGFRRVTYFLDQPDVLSRFTTTIVADKEKFPYLLSNGNLIDLGQYDDGRHWAKWEDPFKKPSYLFALVAGDFDLREDIFVTQSDRNIDLRIYVEKGYGDQADHAMYSLKEAMRWDEKTYGREYDLDIYMIVAIGDFNMGAMENKGLNIFNTKYVLAKPATATDDDYIHILDVVGHEYFHNWSGNRVTCRDWFQLSLKEGLTIFRDQTFTEDTLSHTVMRIREVDQLRQSQFPEDAGPLAHPVRPESYIEINNFYTMTVYNKGAEVLRMLQTILGKTLFRKGMDLYFARHDGQAVTIEDYVKTMEDVSGLDLSQFRLWYSQAGTPVVTVTDDYDASKQIYTLTCTQNCSPPFLIPIRMGLLDKQGKAVSLHLNDEPVSDEKVLLLKETTQIFRFKNINEKPIPSLLRDFSAPIKLDYLYTNIDLLFLFKYDQDQFNRWEAGQKYTLNVLLGLVQDYQHSKPLSLPKEILDIYKIILDDVQDDQFLLAEMLLLPAEKYIGEHMQVIDVDAIHAAREFVLHEVALKLENQFLNIYNKYNTNAPYEFNMKEIGRRQFKNRCLFYLLQLPQYTDIGVKQFDFALKTNMTNTQAVLAGLMNSKTPAREKTLQIFYDTWKHDALVVNKWLSLQALSTLPDTLAHIKKLIRHPAFDMKNPNKVYALIGSFGRNAVIFHAANGEGYAFLREIVQSLDKLNPQVSARMVKPLTTWRRYDKERQALMQEQLELLLQDKKISTDLYEIVSKSLE